MAAPTTAAKLAAGCDHARQESLACEHCGTYRRGCVGCQLCLDCLAPLVVKPPEPRTGFVDTVDQPLHPIGAAPGDGFGGVTLK